MILPGSKELAESLNLIFPDEPQRLPAMALHTGRALGFPAVVPRDTSASLCRRSPRVLPGHRASLLLTKALLRLPQELLPLYTPAAAKGAENTGCSQNGITSPGESGI